MSLLVTLLIGFGFALTSFLFFLRHLESRRLDDAWDTIAKLRWDLDSLTINHSRVLAILMDEIGIEVSHTTEQYPINEGLYGPREYYISKFNPPHPDAD